MRVALIIHATALLLASISFANVKSFSPKSDEIVEIKAGLGIATIVHVPDTIQSAIIGDQTAYRIEYVDHAVTIKPLRYGAKTNLYLFTKEQRFNLRLEVVPQNQAYYIVYIKKTMPGTSVRWIPHGKVVSGSGLQLKLSKIGFTNDGFILLDLSVKAIGFLTLAPNDFWLTQGGESKVIQSLFLSKADLKVSQSAFVGMALKKADLSSKDLAIELRLGQKPVVLNISRQVLWN